MKAIDFIKVNNILEEDNNIRVDNAKYHTKSRMLNLDFVLSYAISLDKYLELKKCILKAFENVGCEISFNISYEDDSLSMEEMKDYLKYILENLIKENITFKSFDLNKVMINDNNVSFIVPQDQLGLDNLIPRLKEEFESFGILVNFNLMEDYDLSINEMKNEKEKMEEERLAEERKKLEIIDSFNQEAKKLKKNYKKQKPMNLTNIKDIPSNELGLQMFQEENGIEAIMIEGYVFDSELKKTKGKSSLFTIKVTDDEDSIVVKKWVRSEEEEKLYKTNLKNDTKVNVVGKVEYDSFSRQILINASTIEAIGVREKVKLVDNAPLKRVELHLHTKLSTQDSVIGADSISKMVKSLGMRGFGLTDRDGVYAVSDIFHKTDGNPDFEDFKPIYGVELAYVDDSKFYITLDQDHDISLDDAVYTVVDIETTGFSQTYDEIFQIAAFRVYKKGIVSSFVTFVDPKRKLREVSKELSHVDDSDLNGAPSIEEALPKFFEFAKDSILVGHNVKFDYGFIYAKAEMIGLDVPKLPAIDTCNLFRTYQDQEKSYNLEKLCKYFKVKEDAHHRADDDANCTAQCFIKMLDNLKLQNVNNYNEINNIIDKELMWKRVIPSSINLLAQNQVGYKNLYRLLSDAMTAHLYREPRLLKSVLEKYHEGILVSSGGQEGLVFEYALNRSVPEVEEEMKMCDYIEVQPPMCYANFFSSLPEGKKNILEVINLIINTAKRLGKIVCATSDCHYFRPEEKKFWDILVQTKMLGGGLHRFSKADYLPDMYFRTTDEMLDEFSFLDEELRYEIVVANTNKIFDSCEKIKAFTNEMYSPRDDQFKDSLNIPSIKEEMTKIVNDNIKKIYGENVHPIIRARADRELNSIISFGNASVYYTCYLMVKKSNEDGYVVGSRGSVGSSFVATMMNITEVNPLSPHYVCKKCHFHALKMTDEEIEKYPLNENEAKLQPILRSVSSGFDLPDMACPCCGNKMHKDGHSIPFETFLGFNGDKIPDIDLNFSGDYQPTAMEYIRGVFGYDNSFRGGTVSTISTELAYGYVKGYAENKKIVLRDAEIDRLKTHILDVKRSTGQHPGGIVVVPNYADIFDVTPIQYPANDPSNSFRTTHFDYHSFENNLLKFDILAHDNPTVLKYIMDYVHLHQADFPFDNIDDIPIADQKIYELCNGTEVIGLTKEELHSQVASFGMPELGTNFVRGMLVETKPKTFAQLVKISGLSHGTLVWQGNAQELVKGSTEYGKIEFKDIIGCRDDIMVDLMDMGMEPGKAFKIMEFVRKNKKAKDPEGWVKLKTQMQEANVPNWYIWSCEQIEYMFPKAHAIAYVIMALRLGWFKIYSPKIFYASWFTIRAKGHDVDSYLKGPRAIEEKIADVRAKEKVSATDESLITAIEIAYEMTLRGIKFLPIDLEKSDSVNFLVEDDGIRIPFVEVNSLGAAQAENIKKAREEKPFSSVKDFMKRSKLNQTLTKTFEDMNVFDNLDKEEKIEDEGIFAFN